MPEQLALEKRIGERRYVDGDERVVPSGGEVMDAAGHQLLARSRFSRDEHR